MSVSLPWISWYPSQWLASEARLTMSVLERSVYFDLLMHAYESGSIPDNHAALAMMAAVSIADFDRAWSTVSRKFTPHPTESGRLINARAYSELSRREAKQAAGKAGGVSSGKVRAKQTNEAGASPENEAPALHKKKQIQTQKKTEITDSENEQHCSPNGERLDDSPQFNLNPLEEKQPDPREAQFTQFWAKYLAWRSSGKKRAHQVFMRIVKSETVFQEIMDGLHRQDALMLSRNPEHRPMASSWLSGERYADELGAEAPSTQPSGRNASGAIGDVLDQLFTKGTDVDN